ncbi:hypothetical protein MMC09_003098 [Bachmanniomyces sp. S44760]|nr:hypothetical protein [Bachmanniomyces sp. S44760]
MTYSPAKDIPDLGGKVFFLTGGTAGLGAGCLQSLMQHGPSHVYFTGRSTANANRLIDNIRQKVPNATITFMECDLSSFASVQTVAKRFLAESARLDVLICNAGIMAVDAGISEDGYEIQFQVNHLAHALLIKLLLPLMLKTAQKPDADVRIVNMASIAYQQAPKSGIEFSSLKSSQPSLGNPLIPGPRWSRYGQRKLANLLYPQALAKRYPQILSVSVHPGVIMTDLFTHVSFTTRLPVLIGSFGRRTSIEEGPYNQLWAATSPRNGIKNGEYYEPIGVVGKRTTKQARNEQLSEQLWDWTQKALGKYE